MAEKTVLVVDRDGNSRNFLAGILAEKQCRILETSLAKEGLIFAWRDHPDLILVDPNLTDLPGEELMRRLRSDPRTESLPAIALSSDPDAQRKDACLEAGFNTYLNKSAECIPALKDAIDQWLALPDEFLSQKNGRQGGLLIVFLSAKGGTGASSLCANLAMGIKQHNSEARVAVLDFVLPIGSIASIVGYDGQANLVTLAELPPEKTDTAFFSEGLPNLPAWRFHLLAGSLDPESASNLRIDRLAQIVGALKAAYDYVFIDIGRSLSKVVLPIIQQADLVALIISADLGAVKLTRLVWQYLQSKGLSPDHIYPILNRVVGFEGVTKPEVEQQLGLPIRTTIPHLSGNLSLANNQHIPLALKFPGDSSTVILKETALQMMELADRMRAGTRRERGG